METEAQMGLGPRLDVTKLVSRKHTGSQHTPLPTHSTSKPAPSPWKLPAGGGSHRVAARDGSGSLIC